MFHDDDHPDVTLRDWKAFCNQFSPYLIEEVIDRRGANLPAWFVPLARGIGIPSSYLLDRAGYRPGTSHRPGWFKSYREQLWKAYGEDYLIVEQCQYYWKINRSGTPSRPRGFMNSTLVHQFGSTPILARTYHEATFLAEFCFHNGLPPGLRWVQECPDDLNEAIDFAQNRRIDEKCKSETNQTIERHHLKGEMVERPPSRYLAVCRRLS